MTHEQKIRIRKALSDKGFDGNDIRDIVDILIRELGHTETLEDALRG